MRGHLPLIAMRRRGIRPAAVWFSLDETDPRSADWHQRHEPCVVEVLRGEGIGSLDLRFTVGMTVIVQGSNRDRCEAMHRALRAAGAAKVVTHAAQPTGRGDEFETVLQLVDDRTTMETA